MAGAGTTVSVQRTVTARYDAMITSIGCALFSTNGPSSPKEVKYLAVVTMINTNEYPFCFSQGVFFKRVTATLNNQEGYIISLSPPQPLSYYKPCRDHITGTITGCKHLLKFFTEILLTLAVSLNHSPLSTAHVQRYV